MEYKTHILDIVTLHRQDTGTMILHLGGRTTLQFALHGVELTAEGFVLGFEFDDAVVGAGCGVFVDCEGVR